VKGLEPFVLVVPSLREAWDDVVAPWFERVAPQAWTHPVPSLVLVPTRGHANYFKTYFIAKGWSHLGLRIVTPPILRALLGREEMRPFAAPEDLRLLLAIAASELEQQSAESEALAAKAAARQPALLLRALDRLEIAGWKFEQLGLTSFAPVVQRFNELRQKCDFLLPGEIDRRRLQAAVNGPKKFSYLLVAGFDAAHWPEWFLLRATVELAERATVVLEEPGENFSEIDLSWIGSWEEICGEAERSPSRAQPPCDSFFTEAEMRGGLERAKTFDFLVGTNISEQAEAITRQCVRYLAEEKCTRLGVIFPGKGALPRLVANSLARAGIPHNDGLAHTIPGIFESVEWQAWIELQRAPRLGSFLRFLNTLPDAPVLSRDLSRPTFENILRKSYSELLVDDLAILRDYCFGQSDPKFQSAAEALRDFPLLAASATFAEFLKTTAAALEYLGWKQCAFEIAGSTRDWPRCVDAKFSRALFLRWLEETAETFNAARLAAGDHPYARVQLLTVAQSQNQEWSHLIFGGWNEGAWPAPPGAEFARAEDIDAFNRSVQQLNKRAARQGSHGEGHISIRENYSLYLGPVEQRAIALRQFDALLESATEQVTLAASLMQEEAPERFWNPSECFTDIYLKIRGAPLTQAALKDLQRATAQWLKDSEALTPGRATPATNVQQTLVAFDARRDASKPAGEYDFALRGDGSYPFVPTLSVTDFERMVSSPAIIWMKRYLGVEAPDDTANPWAVTTGKWVHDWLARISKPKKAEIFGPFPSPATIDRRICASADQCRSALQQLCDSSGKKLSDWWNSGWLNARYVARYLGNKIATAKGWPWMATELRIGRDGAAKIDEKRELQLCGQIDLVLAHNAAADLAGQKIWIIDYKTGSTKGLKISDLHDSLVKGTALQLGLYALAINHCGAAEVSVSILSLAVKDVAPQLAITDLESHMDIFADLAAMQQTGIFGMKGDIRPAFGYRATYPLATLQIDNDILEDKWALTHPALVLEKEEWETW
jgi:PD-(D/E)XK nuclease superfamily